MTRWVARARLEPREIPGHPGRGQLVPGDRGEGPGHQGVDRDRHRGADPAQPVHVGRQGEVQGVGSGRLEGLEPPDALVEIVGTVEHPVGPGQQHEVVVEGSGRLDRGGDALGGQLGLVGAGAREVGVLDRDAG